MEFLTVGQIVRTIGLKGEVKVYPSTHFRDTRFKKGSHVFLLDESNNIKRELVIKAHHKNGECDNLIFEDIATIEEAELINKEFLYAAKDSKNLTKDQYFYSDLVGCEVKFDNGTSIGNVKKIEEYSSYATLRISGTEKDVLIPFVKAFVDSVSIEDKLIIVKYIKGLL